MGRARSPVPPTEGLVAPDHVEGVRAPGSGAQHGVRWESLLDGGWPSSDECTRVAARRRRQNGFAPARALGPSKVPVEDTAA
eukprot:10676850-Alexandrium_andersonii.AAC.1